MHTTHAPIFTDEDEYPDHLTTADEVYCWWLRERRNGVYAAMSAVADAPSAPVLVHCHAGKDRTGVVIALVLRLAGVGIDDIADDYAESGVQLAEMLARDRITAVERGTSAAVVERLYTVRREVMVLTMQCVDEEHGGAEQLDAQPRPLCCSDRAADQAPAQSRLAVAGVPQPAAVASESGTRAPDEGGGCHTNRDRLSFQLPTAPRRCPFGSGRHCNPRQRWNSFRQVTGCRPSLLLLTNLHGRLPSRPRASRTSGTPALPPGTTARTPRRRSNSPIPDPGTRRSRGRREP